MSNDPNVCGGNVGCRIGGALRHYEDPFLAVAFECCGEVCAPVCTLGAALPNMANAYMMLHALAHLVFKALIMAAAVFFAVTGVAYWLHRLRVLLERVEREAIRS